MILKLLALGGAGYAVSRWMQSQQSSNGSGNAAFAPDQPQDDPNAVRDAGPDAMRDPAEREWTAVDQAIDESFPASDPPATY